MRHRNLLFSAACHMLKARRIIVLSTTLMPHSHFVAHDRTPLIPSLAHVLYVNKSQTFSVNRIARSALARLVAQVLACQPVPAMQQCSRQRALFRNAASMSLTYLRRYDTPHSPASRPRVAPLPPAAGGPSRAMEDVAALSTGLLLPGGCHEPGGLPLSCSWGPLQCSQRTMTSFFCSWRRTDVYAGCHGERSWLRTREVWIRTFVSCS